LMTAVLKDRIHPSKLLVIRSAQTAIGSDSA
jgi:hypothetical protein